MIFSIWNFESLFEMAWQNLLAQFIAIWKSSTAHETSHKQYDRQTTRTAFNSEDVDCHFTQFWVHSFNSWRTAWWFLDQQKEEKTAKCPHSVNLSRTPRPWMPNKWHKTAWRKLPRPTKAKQRGQNSNNIKEKMIFMLGKCHFLH